MKIYHTCASRNDVETAREFAPSHQHAFGWVPRKVGKFDAPYFLDNGAYREVSEGEAWDREAFRSALETVKEHLRTPDFVVLPDRFGDWELTKQRHETYLPWLRDAGVPFYTVAHPGGGVEEMVRYGVGVGADGIFIGGPDTFKHEFADQLVEEAHDYGLRAHIGKPGQSLTWARDLGADSVDTSSIVRNGYWQRLEKLEAAPKTRRETLDGVGA